MESDNIERGAAPSVATRHLEQKAAIKRKTKRKSRAGLVLPPIRGPPMAYTVATFCAAHGISMAFFYKLRAAGRAPEQIQLGTKVLISTEAAQRWRAERERETAATAAEA